MAEMAVLTTNERWKRAVVGELSSDFLRISTPPEIQEAADRQAALALYHQQISTPYMSTNSIGRLSITIAQAKLIRNYGLTRMDPYVRIRIGHFVYESQTDPNGGKTPRWNRVINSQLPSGVHSLYLEIYDECSFKMDELIAWTEIKIPEQVFHGETHEDWYPLNGKQGDGQEGLIDLVFSFSNTSVMPTYAYQTVPPVLMVPNVAGRAMPVFVSPSPAQQLQQPLQQQQQQPQQQHPQQQQQQQQQQVNNVPVQINPEDVKQVQEMFPNVDGDVVKSVFEANRGDKTITINALLRLTEQ